MTAFQYAYIDESGKKLHKVREASSKQQLEKKLAEEGVLLVSVKLHEIASKRIVKRKGKKVPPRELIEFCIYMTMMVEAGVPLTTSLLDFSEETKNENFKNVIKSVHSAIYTGETLSDSLKAYPHIFPQEFVQLIYAGEKTGTLDKSFHELQEYLEWQEKTNSEIRQATLYPKIVSVVLGAFVLYLFSGVIPGIAQVLEKLNVPLPMVTKVVIALSDFALANWWLILIGAGGGFFGIKLLIRRNEGFSKFWDRLKLDLPVIGPLVSLIVQARFIKNFGIIHRSGIPVIDNLELCSGFVSNKIFTNSILKVRSKVRDGGQLTEAIKDTRLFSSLVVRMIQLGESTGQLDRSLNYAADYYNKELPRQIKKMFAILEPVLILSLVLLVGTVALAIFLPILSISGSVR